MSESVQHKPWHVCETGSVLTEFGSSISGLDKEEAQVRLEHYGPNQFRGEDRVSAWQILFDQFKNVLIMILLVATLMSVYLGHVVEAIAITVIVLLAIGLGFVQEYRAQSAIKALQKMALPNCRVVRNGEEKTIASAELVPGDIVFLLQGDRVPADGRVLESVNLQVNEASLTGESTAVSKQSDALSDPDNSIGDQVNMAFSGTDVTYGRGKLLIVATGMETEIGKISSLLQTVEAERTPLQQNLDKVGRVLGIAALVIVLMIVVLGVFRGEPVLEMLVFGIALAVAVVPEALPAVVTISLSIGMQRMARRNALVNRLPTVETLGGTSVICSDKTGTLTRDEMTIRRIWNGLDHLEVTGSGYLPEGEFLIDGERVVPDEVTLELLRCGVLASDARLVHDNGWELKGDPTEGALVVAARKAGIDKQDIDEKNPRIDEIPFTSESKRMVTMHRDGDSSLICAKGAPEIVLDSCSYFHGHSGIKGISESFRQEVLETASSMARGALRVIGLAAKQGGSLSDAESHLVFLGLVGMIDPPRQEAAEAIATCRKAGIRPVMITGDHPETAAAIAAELNIAQDVAAMTGVELEKVSDEELVSLVSGIDVYARVSPEHKLRVVNAWKSRGHIVAMTGDGVNDAPALKRADIGIAMGITGTDVSKEAADMTLIDDNFASIVSAVEEGRVIYANIKKYLIYLLSSNIGEIGLLTVAALMGYPLPLTAVQILYINLLTDGLPALALSIDPQEEDLMSRPPRGRGEGLFTGPVTLLMLAGGVWSTAVNFSLFVWALGSGRDIEQAMTMTFTSLVLIEFLKAYAFRSDHLPILNRPFANKWLNLAIAWELCLLLLIVYLPILQEPFGTFSITRQDWGVILLASFSIIPVLELVKIVSRKLHQSSDAE